MRISDWSSDVCSSDLATVGRNVSSRNRAHHEGRGGLGARAHDVERPADLRIAAGEIAMEFTVLDRDGDLDPDALVEIYTIVVIVIDIAVRALRDMPQGLSRHRFGAIQEIIENSPKLRRSMNS